MPSGVGVGVGVGVGDQDHDQERDCTSLRGDRMNQTTSGNRKNVSHGGGHAETWRFVTHFMHNGTRYGMGA
jgi:hypothetical protein